MNLSARLYGGPKDGVLIPLDAEALQSVPYELNLVVYLNLANADPDADVITGTIIYRRRGDYLEAITLEEPIPYEFVGPAKRGSSR